MINRILYIVLLFSICLISCKKYAELPSLQSPSYLRVFNDVITTPNVLHTGQVTAFLTFLMDPVLDQSGVPENGLIVGDYLATRQLYTVSYPYDAANTTVAAGTTNYEYPGRAHVLTAPSMNGLDLSSWAQIPSGKHRIMFVVRPQSDVPFVQLSANQRSTILIDTTVNFETGEVYTLEAALKNADLNTYGAYIRKEDFPHHQFSADSIYLSFYNLSVPKPLNADNPLSQYYNWLTDTLKIKSTYFSYDYVSKNFQVVNPASGLSISLATHFSTRANYYNIPLLRRSYFFDPQNNLGTYDTKDDIQSHIIGGTLPYFGLRFKTIADSVKVNFNVSPNNFNNLYGDFSNRNIYPFSVYQGLPNLNLITNVKGAIGIYPTINILEGVNDRIFMMQIQKGFNQIPQN